MYLRLIGVLLLVPLIDVLLLVVLATRLGPVSIGPVATVAVVVLTALLGLLLVRAEGRHTIRKIQRKLLKGEPPTNELLDGAFLLVAGALMLTPGLVTDVIGLLLVLPPTRYPIRLLVKRYVLTPYLDNKTGGFATGNVYLGGFPDGDGEAGGFQRGFPGGPGGSGEPDGSGSETVEMDDEAYDFEDVSDPDDTTVIDDFEDDETAGNNDDPDRR
jgi:UPF0716 protein FxsA